MAGMVQRLDVIKDTLRLTLWRGWSDPRPVSWEVTQSQSLLPCDYFLKTHPVPVMWKRGGFSGICT